MNGLHPRRPWAALLALLPSLVAPSASAQEPDDWRIERSRWSGPLEAASAIEIRNEHGDVRCRLSDGDEVLVLAVIQSHRDDPDEAQVEVTRAAGSLEIEVVYRTRQDGVGGSLPEGAERRRVDVTVLVPAGPSLAMGTDDGLIEAKGVENDVRARSASGDVTISTGGTVEARTERGALEVTLRGTDWRAPPRLETVTGRITLWLPADTDATVEAATEGILSTDFSIQITREPSGRRKTARAVIGEGTGGLTISSVKGDVRLFRLPG